MGRVRVGYPSDVTDEEWALVLPYLLLCREDSPHREHDLCEVFNGLRFIAKTGCQWRRMPNDLPPRAAAYQQTRRWMAAGCFEALVADVQPIVREWRCRKGQPTAACLDSRTLQSTPESGARAGYDGARRLQGSKVHWPDEASCCCPNDGWSNEASPGQPLPSSRPRLRTPRRHPKRTTPCRLRHLHVRQIGQSRTTTS